VGKEGEPIGEADRVARATRPLPRMTLRRVERPGLLAFAGGARLFGKRKPGKSRRGASNLAPGGPANCLPRPAASATMATPTVYSRTALPREAADPRGICGLRFRSWPTSPSPTREGDRGKE